MSVSVCRPHEIDPHTAIGFDRVRISKEESFKVRDIAAVYLGRRRTRENKEKNIDKDPRMRSRLNT